MRCAALVLLVVLATLDPAVGCGPAASAAAAGALLRRLALEVGPSGPIGGAALRAARREARALWGPAGVDIVDRPSGADVTLRVVWIALPRGSRAAPLAALRFGRDGPEAVIRVSDEAVLAAAASGVAPQPVTDEAVGRVLGRALAHEIGHYLRGEPGHAAAGLMQAGHTAAEFAGRNRGPFEVRGWPIALTR
jgi:hypothetical protein